MRQATYKISNRNRNGFLRAVRLNVRGFDADGAVAAYLSAIAEALTLGHKLVLGTRDPRPRFPTCSSAFSLGERLASWGLSLDASRDACPAYAERQASMRRWHQS